MKVIVMAIIVLMNRIQVAMPWTFLWYGNERLKLYILTQRAFKNLSLSHFDMPADANSFDTNTPIKTNED